MVGDLASRPALAGPDQLKHRNASIREILGLPKRHHLGTIPMYQWIHLVLADKLAYDGRRLILVRRNEMGEWSEYFEDFPEENSANYDERGRYCAPNSPQGYQLAQSRRIQAANQARTSELNAEIHAIIAKHKKQ